MSNWHVDGGVLARFVDNDPLDHVTVASIEQHLATCARCQHDVAARTPVDLLDKVWSGVAERVDRSESGAIERWLIRAGIEPAPVRLLGATPALRAATIGALVLVVAALVLASRVADSGGVFLALAPVVPTALVAISFATNADPGGECGLATPRFGVPLLLRRALAVEGLALVVVGAGSLFVSLDGARTVAWLLPATALSAVTLAAGARWPTTHVAAVLYALWFGALAVGEVIGRGEGGTPFTGAPFFELGGQLAALALLIGSIGLLFSRRHTIYQEVTR